MIPRQGLIIIDKPQGWTSHDVTAKLRGLLSTRRVGHAGTLDPDATGVLPVLYGRATSAAQYLSDSGKEYSARFVTGITTDTQDTSGNITARSETAYTTEELIRIIDSFRGETEQIPPMYSAVKINGKKLYSYAREGKRAEVAPRTVEIRHIEYLGEQDGEHKIYIACSKGTYIRTICHDIGQKLGTGAAMSYLRRTRHGNFSLENAVPLQKLLESPHPHCYIMPTDSVFLSYPSLYLDGEQAARYKNGVHIETGACDGEYRLYCENGPFLALARANGGILKPVCNFYDTVES